MIQNLTLLDINMPQLLLIYDRRMYIDNIKFVRVTIYAYIKVR